MKQLMIRAVQKSREGLFLCLSFFLFGIVIVTEGCAYVAKAPVRGMSNSKKEAFNFNNYIKWNDRLIENFDDPGWKSFSVACIKKAIEEIPPQGSHGSCTVNSAARAIVLCDDELIPNFSDFLSKSKHLAMSFQKHRNDMANAGLLSVYDSLVSFQSDFYKDDMKTTENILAECFEEGSSFTQIGNWISKSYLQKRRVNIHNYNDFRSCANSIQYHIASGNPIVGDFCSGENRGTVLGHAMNIIGYYQPKGKPIECFVLLNTWGKGKTIGKISYASTELCMNRGGVFSLMSFER